jgi:hypothetical protein
MSDDATRQMLKLRPPVIGGDKLQDDYEVLDENRKPAGRILLHPQGPQGRPWFWGTNRVPNIPGHDRGFAESREQAMADFKTAWLRKTVVVRGS